MLNTSLILRTLSSPFGDLTKGSVLAQADVDNNFLYLKGNDILTGTTSGSVITLIRLDGQTISFGISGSSGFDLYTNSTPTPTTIGGISAGSTFNAQTMQQMWTSLLYPYQSPAFTSFSLGIGLSEEIGYIITTGQTFTWGTSNSSNVSGNSVSISGYNLITLNGLANSGSEAVSFTAPITRTSTDGPGSRSWSISAVNTESGSLSDSLTINWNYKLYAGTSSSTSLTAGQITGLTDYNSVKNGFAGTYSFDAGNYKYVSFADTYGSPVSWVDTSNNLNVAMNYIVDGYYTNTDASGNVYALVSVTNEYGQTTNYRVYRTLNSLGGSINIAVS